MYQKTWLLLSPNWLIIECRSTAARSFRHNLLLQTVTSTRVWYSIRRWGQASRNSHALSLNNSPSCRPGTGRTWWGKRRSAGNRQWLSPGRPAFLPPLAPFSRHTLARSRLIDGRPVNSDVRPKDWVAAAAMTSRQGYAARSIRRSIECDLALCVAVTFCQSHRSRRRQ